MDDKNLKDGTKAEELGDCLSKVEASNITLLEEFFKDFPSGVASKSLWDMYLEEISNIGNTHLESLSDLLSLLKNQEETFGGVFEDEVLIQWDAAITPVVWEKVSLYWNISIGAKKVTFPAGLDPKQKKYLDSGGVLCPQCGSDQIEGSGGYDADGSTIFHKISCLSCEHTWTDVYTLTSFME